MADVFISYGSEDRDRVRPLAEALQARGFSVWWDRALAAGDDYAAIIERELAEAKAVVVAWSRTSAASSWVRDEAARAQETGRLVPVRLDAVDPPLGFGQTQAEDFTAWTGAAGAAEIDILAEALKARLAGAPVDAAALAAKRKRLAIRVRVMSILGMVALIAVVAGGVAVFMRTPAAKAPAIEAAPDAGQTIDPLAQLLKLVDEGKITGEQAVRLAELLKQQAFSDIPSGARAPATGPGQKLAADADAAVETAAAAFDDTARSAYAEAAVQLLQDPDPRVREALLETSRPQSRADGMEKLLALAADGKGPAAAIYRAAGALMAAANDPRARDALEHAQRLNPQDMRVWSMLSVAYGRERRARDAAGAALIGEGLQAAGLGRRDEAVRTLETALDYIRERPDSRAFVLGQLGDDAAARSDWDAAESRYREAVRLHTQTRDPGAMSVEVAKLARAHLAQGRPREACKALKKAIEAGATVSPSELDTACRPEATGGVGPPGPLRITPAPVPPG